MINSFIDKCCKLACCVKHYIFWGVLFFAGLVWLHCYMWRPALSKVVVRVSDFKAATEFYDALFAKLKMVRVKTYAKDDKRSAAGYGFWKKASFWIKHKNKEGEVSAGKKQPKIVFAAPCKDSVDQWFAEGIRLGAKEKSKPGCEKHRHGGYSASLKTPEGYILVASYKPCCQLTKWLSGCCGKGCELKQKEHKRHHDKNDEKDEGEQKGKREKKHDQD